MDGKLIAGAANPNPHLASLEREAHVYYAPLQPLVGSTLLESCRAWLSAEERLRCERFQVLPDRLSFLAAHGLLRFCLSRYSPAVAPAAWRFLTDAKGRPELYPEENAARLRFNLSHSREMVACIVTAGQSCGVDVETLGRLDQPMDLAGRFFARQEVEDLLGLAEPARALRFCELWTLKEACAKALGDGLRLPLDRLAFRIEGGRPWLTDHDTAGPIGRQWRLLLARPGPTQVLAAALCGEGVASRVVRVHPAARIGFREK